MAHFNLFRNDGTWNNCLCPCTSCFVLATKNLLMNFDFQEANTAIYFMAYSIISMHAYSRNYGCAHAVHTATSVI